MTGVFLIILACGLWGLDALIRYPLINSGVSASSIVFTEHVFLVLFFSPIIWKMRKKLLKAQASDIFYFIIIGGIGSALATISFTRAFALINPSLVILLQKFQPLFAIILARLVLKEKIGKEFVFWAVICLLGAGLISYKDLSGGLSSLKWGPELFDQKHLVGYGLTLVAVMAWGSATVFGKCLINKDYKETEIMGGRFLFGLIFLLPLLAGNELPIPKNLEVTGKIILMVSYSGILAMYLYYQGLKRLSARLCTLAEMFFPFCAIAVNWVFLDATLAPMQMAGGALLLLGSTVIQLKRY